MDLKRAALLKRQLAAEVRIRSDCEINWLASVNDKITEAVTTAAACNKTFRALRQHIHHGLGSVRPGVREPHRYAWSCYDWAIFDVLVTDQLEDSVTNQVRAGSYVPVTVRVYLANHLRQSLRGGR